MLESEELIDAVKRGDGARIASLLDETPSLLDAEGAHGVSAILLSVYHGHPEIAEIFVAHGAELDMWEASATGKLERVREWIREDPRLASRFGPDGHTPLGLACFFGHREVVRFLLEHGGGLNTPSRNAQKVAPIHAAVACGDGVILRALLERGADVNVRQEGGFTPLHGAAAGGDTEALSLLLEHGADVTARTVDGRTAADTAKERGHETLAERLLGLEAERS